MKGKISALPQDLAVQKQAAPAFIAQLDSLKALAMPVIPEEGFIDPALLPGLFDAQKEEFPASYDRIAREHDLLFGTAIDDYGPRTGAVFTKWEEEGGGPSLPAMVALAAEYFGLDSESAVFKAAMMAAVLAEVPNDLQYHGNEHYRKVLFHAIRLMATHNHLFAGMGQALHKHNIALMLAASCIHDLGHEGGDNLRDGVYTPGFMEQRALNICRPYLDATGLDADDFGAIETIVFCTDITFFAGDNSPCVRMKKLFKFFFWDEDVGDASLLMMGKLRRYEDNPQLVRMAMMLHEADVGTSAGVTYEQTQKETINIIEERGLKTAGPGIVLTFLREQLGETMYTEAAKQLFGPMMAEVIKTAESDVAAGRKTFYE